MDIYNSRGVSSRKEDVHEAIKNLDKGLFPNAFCKILLQNCFHKKNDDVTQFFAYKSSLVAILCGFYTAEMWPVHGGSYWTSSGVEWPSRMPIHARFAA